MRIKTMIIILITVLLTIVLVENSGEVPFWFFGITHSASKLTMMLLVGIVAFILGVLVGRPTRVQKLGNDYAEEDNNKSHSDTLSDDDREYIS